MDHLMRSAQTPLGNQRGVDGDEDEDDDEDDDDAIALHFKGKGGRYKALLDTPRGPEEKHFPQPYLSRESCGVEWSGVELFGRHASAYTTPAGDDAPFAANEGYSADVNSLAPVSGYPPLLLAFPAT